MAEQDQESVSQRASRQRTGTNGSGWQKDKLPKGPRAFLEKKKPGPQQTNVYVRIHDVIGDIHLLGEVLTSKVNTPGVELIPTETCVRHSGSYTFCTLTCSSRALAKKLKQLLIKDRLHFTPLIDCSFSDFISEELQREQLIKAKAELKKKVDREFEARSEQVLRSHNQKLLDIQEKIKGARENLNNLYIAKKARDEIAALEHKYQELLLQKNEFMSAKARFQQKLALMLQKDSYHMEVNDLRKLFGVECCRLAKALPMYARRQDIVQLVQQYPVSILLAETGSGKSTQVVQYLLEAGLAEHGTIVCTQPRKVAAVSLATHVAEELASNVGREVGYKAGTRMKVSPATKVVYMTDHALLNQCLTDPSLKAFSCIVVDEAHERSLFTDLLLAMVKRCVKQRPELRVIITSATIDPQVFVNFFGSCPIMKVSGRAFPVDVVWQDVAGGENEFENYMDAAVGKALDIHDKEPPGDILVFLTSAVEIQKCCDMFQQKMGDRTDFKCFQLHGQLQADEQQKVFEPLDRNKRKVVFATNCAETSITIDGIKYVVDTGVAKEMRYDAKKNIRSLDVTIISQSSAEQRKGRAGRTAPGMCYRLYSQKSFQSMDTISLPEILKTHLGHALLKLAELGVTPDMYDFVQSPKPEAIEAALKTLTQLGALHDGIITDIGRWIAKLPFDPRLGLMTLHGHHEGLLYDTIVLAALVSAGSALFYRGLTEEEHKNLDKSKLKFCDAGGDSITSLKVYKAWQEVDEKQKNKWCVSHSINVKAIRGARDTVNEVCKLLKNSGEVEIMHQFSQAEGSHDKLRKILFLCSASNLSHFLGRDKAGYFAGQASKQVHFHPSSAICFLASYPEWVVYDQLLHTSRDFITGITPVDKSWVQEMNKEKCGFDVEDVRQKKLDLVFTQPAGSSVFFSIVGPRYTKLRQLQENFGVQDSRVVMLEGSKETGEVRVFCTDTADSLKPLIDTVTHTVETAVKEVRHQVFEVNLGDEKSGLRLVLGEGASISDILMPHETRKVFINNPSEDATEDMIKQKFQKFGEITYIHQFSGGQNFGFLIFRTAAQAVAAAEATKQDEYNVAQLESRRHAMHRAEFKARLSWNRRRAKGFGFAGVSPAYFSTCLAIRNLNIGGSLVRIKMDRKNQNNLYLVGLPGDVTEDLIKRSLLHALGESEDAENIVENVSVPRQSVGATTNQELRRLEDEIKRKIEAYLTSSTVQVAVFQPKTEKTAAFVAEARFSDPVEGLAACRNLRVSFDLGGVRVSVEPIISALLRVPQLVFEASKTELDKVCEKLKDTGTQISIRQDKTGVYVISLKAEAVDDIVKARTFLSDVIKGDVLECSDAPAIANLLTGSGREMLKEAEKETSTYIRVDNRLRTVSIHGSQEGCTRVRLKINKYLDEVILGMGEEVALYGAGRPPGLLKALHGKYGEDLDTLRQQTGLHSIVIDYRRHKLKLRGPPQSLQKSKQALEDVEKSVKASCVLDTNPDEDSIDCGACFCPIDPGDLYRLEACAHPVCKDCIAHQVNVAIKDRQIPIICCHEDCNVPLAWRDFNKLAQLGYFKLSTLATSAVSAFVLANRDKARFCTTPDCPMVYRVTDESEAKVFLCPECGTRVCTACHEQAHDGMTCAMMRSSKQEDGGVDVWVSQDRKNRKACPGCRIPIQKTMGCNKMHCTACGVIFCWLCTQKFLTDNACYDHLTRNHNGIFDVEDLLQN